MAFEISYDNSFDATNTQRYLIPFDSVSVSNLVNDYEDSRWHAEMMQLFLLDNLAETIVTNQD